MDANGVIPLRPKTFEVLHYLVRNAGQLVSREDVFAAVWPNVTVTEESLTQCVSEVRQALGGAGQAIIRTVPKRGYLFDVPVRQVEAASQTEAPFAVGRPEDGLLRHDAAFPAPRAQLEGPAIVVLPFLNLSGDPGVNGSDKLCQMAA